MTGWWDSAATCSSEEPETFKNSHLSLWQPQVKKVSTISVSVTKTMYVFHNTSNAPNSTASVFFKTFIPSTLYEHGSFKKPMFLKVHYPATGRRVWSPNISVSCSFGRWDTMLWFIHRTFFLCLTPKFVAAETISHVLLFLQTDVNCPNACCRSLMKPKGHHLQRAAVLKPGGLVWGPQD